MENNWKYAVQQSTNATLAHIEQNGVSLGDNASLDVLYNVQQEVEKEIAWRKKLNSW